MRNAFIDFRREGRSFTGVFLELSRYLTQQSLEDNVVVQVRLPAELASLRSRFRTLHTWQARVEHAREKLVAEGYRLGLDRSELRYLLELPEGPGPLPDPVEGGAW